MSSTEAKRRSAAAGAANLAKWKRENPGGSNRIHGLFAELNQQVPAEVRELVDEFEEALRAELGGKVSAIERALIHSARVSYTIVLLGQKYLDSEKVAPRSVRERRRKGLASALTVINVHQATLLRVLHTLGVRNKRARSDEDTNAEVDAVVEEIRAARGGKHEAAEPC